MPNVFEAVIDYIKTTIDTEPKPRPHIGEAMGCWLYYTAISEEIPALEASLNTTTDDELIKLLKRSLNLAQHQKKTLEKFMIEEGIPLSRVAQSKPKSDPNDVPLGVKVTDDEIANYISIKIASNIVMASSNLAESIRSDIGLMWARFHAEKMVFGMELKTAMRKRGWIKVPPYYYPQGAPRN
ncbi:DUF3231 family protein [Neobacillus ginsengisoli]|uniref:DUF3231 family protein n=1 Tax=Neobacillus ginsengisoli TaxID=904295 RepID=A0ABT9XYY7_9BACI|nr:DUF3231 family protein [Neobacillus ginsengisoli]MDQ0200794.1 hypothetical protein [Neobacillus ginsengisoli]